MLLLTELLVLYFPANWHNSSISLLSASYVLGMWTWVKPFPISFLPSECAVDTARSRCDVGLLPAKNVMELSRRDSDLFPALSLRWISLLEVALGGFNPITSLGAVKILISFFPSANFVLYRDILAPVLTCTARNYSTSIVLRGFSRLSVLPTTAANAHLIWLHSSWAKVRYFSGQSWIEFFVLGEAWLLFGLLQGCGPKRCPLLAVKYS